MTSTPRAIRGCAALVALMTCALLLPSLASATIVEYPVPTGGATPFGWSSSEPLGITAGPDGALWFAEANSGKIGRITLQGAITEFTPPGGLLNYGYPKEITTGSDGALWFTDTSANAIERLTTTGVFSQFRIPSYNTHPLGIAAGSDGALWFTEERTNVIGRVTTNGVFSEFPIPTTALADPNRIAAGPDGALWFTESTSGQIGRITTGGVITQFQIPTPSSDPVGITAGPDGAVWFTEAGANKIGRITTSGSFTEFPLTPGSSGNPPTRIPSAITAGPDGAVWFTEREDPGAIGRITPAGRISELPIPSSNSAATGITNGPDGALWFTEFNANKIGRAIAYPMPQSAPALTSSLVPTFKQCGTLFNPAIGDHAPASAEESAPHESCVPPTPTANIARVGEQSVGSAQLSVVPGDLAVNVSTNDVQALDGSPYDPTPGSSGADLTLSIRLRITDNALSCLPSPCGEPYDSPATVSDVDFSVPLDCEQGGLGVGSTCQANTTANAVEPGLFRAGARAVVEAARLRLIDGANSLFEQQGYFEP